MKQGSKVLQVLELKRAVPGVMELMELMVTQGTLLLQQGLELLEVMELTGPLVKQVQELQTANQVMTVT